MMPGCCLYLILETIFALDSLNLVGSPTGVRSIGPLKLNAVTTKFNLLGNIIGDLPAQIVQRHLRAELT